MTTLSAASNSETPLLRRFIGLDPPPGGLPSSARGYTSLFFLECTPASPRPARCAHVPCSRFIDPQSNRYRISLYPGMRGTPFSPTPDLYHVRCFESVASMNVIEFLDRIQVLTRSIYQMRGLKTTNLESYLVDGGMERLFLKWKVQHGKWVDVKDGKGFPREDMDTAFKNIYENAGSRRYVKGEVQGLDAFNRTLLEDTLAPNESDGPYDDDEWNLFQNYLEKDSIECVQNEFSLSDMVARWDYDLSICALDDEQLTEEQAARKVVIGRKGVRAIRRLFSIPMPDIQGLRYGGTGS